MTICKAIGGGRETARFARGGRKGQPLTYDFSATLTGIVPLVLLDEDNGIAAALRCDAEFEPNPSLGLSLEELNHWIEGRRS